MEYSITVSLGFSNNDICEFQCVSAQVFGSYLDGVNAGIRSSITESIALPATITLHDNCRQAFIAGYSKAVAYVYARITESTWPEHVGIQVVDPSYRYLIEVDDENPNDNCLSDMQCPSCFEHGPFEIVATATALVHDDGTDDSHGFDYDLNDPCTCNNCRHHGQVMDFNRKARRKMLSLMEIADVTELSTKQPVVLDDMVHDAFSAQASSVNNDGVEAQIRYLLAHGWASGDEIYHAIKA